MFISLLGVHRQMKKRAIKLAVALIMATYTFVFTAPLHHVLSAKEDSYLTHQFLFLLYNRLQFFPQSKSNDFSPYLNPDFTTHHSKGFTTLHRQ